MPIVVFCCQAKFPKKYDEERKRGGENWPVHGRGVATKLRRVENSQKFLLEKLHIIGKNGLFEVGECPGSLQQLGVDSKMGSSLEGKEKCGFE